MFGTLLAVVWRTMRLVHWLLVFNNRSGNPDSRRQQVKAKHVLARILPQILTMSHTASSASFMGTSIISTAATHITSPNQHCASANTLPSCLDRAPGVPHLVGCSPHEGEIEFVLGTSRPRLFPCTKLVVGTSGTETVSWVLLACVRVAIAHVRVIQGTNRPKF